MVLSCGSSHCYELAPERQASPVKAAAVIGSARCGSQWRGQPLAIPVQVFFVDVAWKTTSSWWGFGIFGGFLCLFGRWSSRSTYLKNQNAIRDGLEPKRQELLKLVESLENGTEIESSQDIFDLVTGVVAYEPCQDFGWADWANNWNLIVPSWVVAAAIILPTLFGAYLGARYPIPEMGPVFLLAGRVLVKNGGRSNCTAWTGFAPEHRIGVAIVANSGGYLDPIGLKLLEQTVPSAKRKLVPELVYAKLAPFTGVRWENDRPVVCVHEKWSPLKSIDGIAIDQIMTFAEGEFGAIAHKRFAEDLVEVLSKMGHEPGRQVNLGLEMQNGQVEEVQILMTKGNRDLIYGNK